LQDSTKFVSCCFGLPLHDVGRRSPDAAASEPHGTITEAIDRVSPILNWPEALALIAFIAPTARAQNAADSESEDRNAAAFLVKDSGYWNKEPCPASGYVSNTAFARFSLNR